MINVNERALAFCHAHGLAFHPADSDGRVSVGQTGFWLADATTEDELTRQLDRCLQEQLALEAVAWEKGLLYQCLGMIKEDPVKWAIEEELAAILPKDALDKIARVFCKHIRRR
jgi:hypothetical protein